MISLVQDNREAIEALCRKYYVKRLKVFGSAATGEFDPARSDVDFLVDFESTPAMNRADQYFGLLEELQELFAVPVDLVTLKASRNPYFIKSINETRKLLYAA